MLRALLLLIAAGAGYLYVAGTGDFSPLTFDQRILWAAALPGIYIVGMLLFWE